jgi:hypothetical protein
MKGEIYMYYDEERDTIFKTIEEMNDSILAVTTPSMAENMIVRCLYHIANELHEINLSLRAGVNDGR